MWWESPRAQLGLLVDASALPMHLSLSLSLSGPSGSPGLTAETRRAANPLVGRINCCHARGDVLRPRGVASDRTPAYKATNGRQAHCERSRHARGGVAGTNCASFSRSTLSQAACFDAPDARNRERFRHARGGAAASRLASFLQRCPRVGFSSVRSRVAVSSRPGALLATRPAPG